MAHFGLGRLYNVAACEGVVATLQAPSKKVRLNQIALYEVSQCLLSMPATFRNNTLMDQPEECGEPDPATPG